jgi:hypothetical protein
MSGNAFSVELSDNSELEQQMLLLDKISYHPSLLPLIMQNIDYLDLTPEQQKKLRDWRQTNASIMLDKMKEVAQGRIEFIDLALNSDASEDDLVEKQHQLFRLQEEVLTYKLACRKNILETFTQKQWDELLFILAEHQLETIQ